MIVILRVKNLLYNENIQNRNFYKMQECRERLPFPPSSEYILLSNGLSGNLLVFYHILVVGH